ncbi:MAG: 16S rRNA (cytidine(1402)-2'-O)-methyltransferase [Ruminococcaceae bacterium]|nr:16S rRNA (cytidine(1402)-2'-O)-methyltransferase [Oscillospiraceae bacterium]
MIHNAYEAEQTNKPVKTLEKGTLYLVATPIGNLEDITLRGIRILRDVDLIAAEDTRRTATLLNHLGIKTPLTSYFQHNEKSKGSYILDKLQGGATVALVSDAGTPAISDPGEELVRLCAENGVSVVSVPGATAAISALICSGLPTGRFSFEGFLSINKKSRRDHLLEIKQSPQTMIFYEAPHKLRRTLRDLYQMLGERRLVLARELTKIHEEIIRTTLSEAIEIYQEREPKGEYVLVLEGATSPKETENELNNLTVLEHINHYITLGFDQKTAQKAVAADRGVTKREIYASALQENEGNGAKL